MTNILIDESAFQRFWGSLLKAASEVPFPDREDLVSEAITKGLETFDESKGTLHSFCHVILKNLVKNHWRDKKKTIPIEEDWFGVEPVKVFNELESEMARGEIKEFKASLTNEEQAFVEMLGTVLLEMDGRAISETAHRLGLTALQGHDVLRRIRTKAEKNPHLRNLSATTFPELPDEVVLLQAEMVPLLRDTPDEGFHLSSMKIPTEDVGVQVKLMAPLLALQKGMNRFLGSLSENEKTRLGSLL